MEPNCQVVMPGGHVSALSIDFSMGNVLFMHYWTIYRCSCQVPDF